MKRRIYLASSKFDDNNLGKELSKAMKQIMPDTINVTVILGEKAIFPTETFYRYAFKSRGILEGLGFTIDHFQTISSGGNTSVDQLMESDVVFLAGGDPISQLELVNYINLEEHLREYDKGIIFGHSAGSMAMGDDIIFFPTISTNLFKVTKMISSLRIAKGLNLDNITVIPHAKFISAKRINVKTVGISDFSDAAYLNRFTSPIIGIPDGTALYIQDDELFHLGNLDMLSITNGNISSYVTEKTPSGKRLILEKTRACTPQEEYTLRGYNY